MTVKSAPPSNTDTDVDLPAAGYSFEMKSAVRLALSPLAALAILGCSSTTVNMPTWGDSRPSAVISESTNRATSAYQQCATQEALKLPAWNLSLGTPIQAATKAVDLCKAREQQLYEVVLVDSRGSPSSQSFAEGYVKSTREKLINSLAPSFLQQRR